VKFKDKLLDRNSSVTMFEIVPPEEGKPEALEDVVREAAGVRPLVDAINLPEIHDEARGGERTYRFVPRVEPRLLGDRIQHEVGVEAVINRVTVYDSDPVQWLTETRQKYGIEHVVLVGGESTGRQYAGPGPGEAAKRIRDGGLPLTLGGISIPSRTNEAERIRKKADSGMTFFTTQVLFDSNDIVWLIQKLNGLQARIFLSFAPVSHPGDLKFLRWLGSDLPPSLDRFLLTEKPDSPKETCCERSLDLAQRILMDVFDNLPPDPPLIGLNIEHVNRRNLSSAVRMLERLGGLYSNLVAAQSQKG
jgi:5,10-methylenetetrahydrofolate reductase